MELLQLLFILLGLLILSALGLILYARWNFGTLEALGIPVVKPHFLFGSTWETRHLSVGERDLAWTKKYGQVFGVYKGRTPHIFVTDPDLIRLIMVKDAQPHFDQQGPVNFEDSVLNEMPDYLPKEKWKIVRSFTSTAFTTAKLRLMNLPIKESLQDFVTGLKDKIQKSEGRVLTKCAFDEVLFTAMTDLTARSLFSIKDSDRQLPCLLKELTQPAGLRYPTLMTMSQTFPFILNMLPPTLVNPTPTCEFVELMEQQIASRKVPNSPPDFVDICMDKLGKLNSPEYAAAGITRDTILCTLFNASFSGQDIGTLVISCMIYHILNSNPELEIEEKLVREIDDLWEENGGCPTRESLIEAEYLQACINEALRLHTFYASERTCTQSWYCEKYNFKVAKGMKIIAPLWAVNRNEEHFENPNEFNPERWLNGAAKDLHPYAYMPFGQGPRHCTGKPLAMEVFRWTIATLFREFRFHLREDSQLKFKPVGAWIFIPYEHIYFDISARNAGLAIP